jgi:hypothetical protein
MEIEHEKKVKNKNISSFIDRSLFIFHLLRNAFSVILSYSLAEWLAVQLLAPQ